MKRILCAWFPNWPIQRLVVDQPKLRCQRIVLFYRDARRGQLASAVSPLAMQEGVTTGMPLSEAKSLLRRGKPTGNSSPLDAPYIFEHDFRSDLAKLESLADHLESFSPIVGVETIEPADLKRGQRPSALFLDVTGLAHLFGDEEQLATQLMLSLEKLGYLPRVAVAPTVGSAWAFARYFASLHFQQHKQPLLIDEESELWDRLPTRALRLEESVTDTLYQLGIENLSQLRRISRNDLAMRFGDAIHRRLDQLTGAIEEPLVARHQPSEFTAEQILDYPTHHRETMEVIIERLAKSLCQQMRAQQQGSLEWTVRLVCQQSEPVEFKVNLFQPTTHLDHVLPLIQMQLERALSPVTRKKRRRRQSTTSPTNPPSPATSSPPLTDSSKTASESAKSIEFQPSAEFHRYTTIEVTEIRVSVSSHVLLVQQQRKLFDESPQLDRQALSHLINRLASRLGPQNVVYPTLQSGAQPEYSYRLKPLVDSRPRTQRKVAKARSQSHVLARPLRLFRPPLRLKNAPRLKNAMHAVNTPRAANATVPMNLRTSSDCLAEIALASPASSDGLNFQPQTVVASSGPERIETGWWRGRTICRDYWRVETETGQHFWIYRDRRTGAWWLHGEF